MYHVLIRLFLIAAFLELGLTISDFTNSNSAKSANNIQQAKAKILKINWKPISVFPEEARKFR